MLTKQIIILGALMLSPIAAQAITTSAAANVPVTATVTSAPITVSADADASTSIQAAADAVLTTLADGDASTSAAADASATPAGLSLGSAASITSDAALASYTKQIVTQDPNVLSIDANASNTISVTYAHHAKLFGFIPVTVNSQTIVTRNSDGSPIVITTYPWWHIFVTGAGSADIDSSLTASAVTQNYLTADTSASARAMVAENIVATLDAEDGVSATTTSSE